MSNINSLFIYQSQLVQASVQNITQKLARSPTTDENYLDLTKELHETFEILRTIKGLAAHILFFQAVTKDLEEELVSLAGRVTDNWIKNKVNQIQQEAANLELSIESGKVTAEAVQELSLHVKSFKQDHLPSLQDRREIAKAEMLVYRARAVLEGEKFQVEKPLHVDPSVEIKGCDLEDSEQLVDPSVEIEGCDLEDSEQLMDIAFSIYRGDIKEARMKFYQLTATYRKRFLTHMQVLDAAPFTDSFASIQAFIAMSQEVLHLNERYSTQDQIEELFEGLSQVNEEEKEDEDKIFSLSSRESLIV